MKTAQNTTKMWIFIIKCTCIKRLCKQIGSKLVRVTWFDRWRFARWTVSSFRVWLKPRSAARWSDVLPTYVQTTHVIKQQQFYYQTLHIHNHGRGSDPVRWVTSLSKTAKMADVYDSFFCRAMLCKSAAYPVIIIIITQENNEWRIVKD